MTLCSDTFEDMKTLYPQTQDLSTEEALKEARLLVSGIQQKVLSQLPNGIKRQMGAILFSHALKALDKPLLLDKPTVWQESKSASYQTPALIAAGIGVVLTLLVSLQLNTDKNPLLLLMVCAAGISYLIALFTKQPKTTTASQKVLLHIDRDALLCFLGEQMHQIDRDIAALDCLLIDEQPAQLPPNVLDTLMKVYEVESREKQLNPETMQAITHFFATNQIEMIEYTAHNAPLFSVLPTLSGTRTLIPALLKDNHLIRQGLAIVKKEVVE